MQTVVENIKCGDEDIPCTSYNLDTPENIMRVIAELPHPDCKITIFSMNQKFIIKLEKGVFEQIYKISELDVPDGVNGIFKLLDADFIKSASSRFQDMRTDFKEAFSRYDS